MQLRTRHDELTMTMEDEPQVPESKTLDQVADAIGDIIRAGNHNQTKALIEALTDKSPSSRPIAWSPYSASPRPRTRSQSAQKKKKPPPKERFVDRLHWWTLGDLTTTLKAQVEALKRRRKPWKT